MPASTVKVTGNDIIMPVGGLVDGVDVGTAVPAAQAAANAAQADATQALADAAAALAAANEADDTADTAGAVAAAAVTAANTAQTTATTAQGTANSHASRHAPGGPDEFNSLAAGSALTDADQTIQWSTTDSYRRMPASTTTTARVKTLGVTNAVQGSCWILDFYAQGHDITFINGGAGGGSPLSSTVAAGTKVRLVFVYDGTNWTRPVRLSLA